MGLSHSSCDAPKGPAFAGFPSASGQTGGEQPAATAKKYIFPVKYEEIQREAYQSLKWDSIDGAKFDVTKMLNPNFFISHRMTMGMKEVDLGTESSRVFRTPSPEYSFTATVAGEKGLMMGTVTQSGVLMSRLNWRYNERFGAKLESQVRPENFAQTMFMFDVDFGGADWNGQLKYGVGGFWGANYMQTVTPWIALGGEVFWLQQQGRSGIGFAARVSDQKSVGCLQVADTGVVSMTYHQKVNDTASVAADFLCNLNQPKDAVASVGYDYQFKQCRLRGSVDSNGKVSALLEEMLGPGLKLLMSGELDHWRSDHKFGVGMTVGE